MGRFAGSRLGIAAVAAAALIAGAAVGWVAKPAPPGPPVPSQRALVADAFATVEDLEKRSAAMLEILNDMIAGRVSRDPGALETLRDSMQEVVSDLGDVKSQIRQLSPSPPPESP